MAILTQVHEALKFYNDHYHCIDNWILQPGKKFFLGDKVNRLCRFCGKRPPEVTFKEEAHAIPVLLGNRSLFTYYECDVCNHIFGKGIENDLGNWSKPMRTMARIKGRKRVPTIKKTDRAWRIEGVPDGLNVKHEEEDPPFEVDEPKKEMVFRLTRDPYTPVAVLKAFVKIGLTLLPEKETPNFTQALKWVRSEDHSSGTVLDWSVFYTVMPGSYRSDLLAVMVCRRKPDVTDLPYAFYVLTYGNEMFQVFLPTPERDQHIEGKGLPIFLFPSPSQTGLAYVQPLDLTGTTTVKDEVVTPVLTFDASHTLPTHGQRLDDADLA